MAAMQPGVIFYGEWPDSYNMTLNTEHSVVKSIMEKAESDLKSSIQPLEDKLAEINKAISAINDKKKNDKELTADDKSELESKEKEAENTREEEKKIISDYASNLDKVKQLVDIALLGNGMLKGEALNNFLQRSISLL